MSAMSPEGATEALLAGRRLAAWKALESVDKDELRRILSLIVTDTALMDDKAADMVLERVEELTMPGGKS